MNHRNVRRTLVLRFIASAVVLAIVFSVTGCTNWETTIFRTLGASKAVVEQAVADYNSGAIVTTPTNKALIEQLQKGHNLAVQAFSDYWHAKLQVQDDLANGKTDKATGQQKINAAITGVNAAVQDLPGLIAQVKALKAH